MFLKRKNRLAIIGLIISFSFIRCFEKRTETDFKNVSGINTTDTIEKNHDRIWQSPAKTDSISYQDTTNSLKNILLKEKNDHRIFIRKPLIS